MGLEALAGGGPDENAGWLRAVVRGEGPRAPREAVALNAGALLWLDDKAADLGQGVALALELLAEGRPAEILEAFVEVSRDV